MFFNSSGIARTRTVPDCGLTATLRSPAQVSSSSLPTLHPASTPMADRNSTQKLLAEVVSTSELCLPPVPPVGDGAVGVAGAPADVMVFELTRKSLEPLRREG